MKKVCPKCGREYLEIENYCTKCGIKLAKEPKSKETPRKGELVRK